MLTTGSRRRTGRRGPRPGAALLGGMVLAGAGLAVPPADVASAATGGWKPTNGALTLNRSFHTATRLGDGKVLVVGGASEETSATAEIYDPATSTFSPTTAPGAPRDRHTATLLGDGRVLVVGGSGAAAATAEIYDPETKAWLPVPPSGKARWNHTATLLPDKRVLVAGGVALGAYDPLATRVSDKYALPTVSAQIYDPAAEPAKAWADAGDMVVGVHSMPAVLLPGGKVLVAGGGTDTICGPHSDRHCGTPTNVAQVFDPAVTDATTGRRGAWKATTNAMTEARSVHAATVLAGKVLVAGGESFELYDPATGLWGGRGLLLGAQGAFPSLTTLRDGKALIVGANTPEVYDPAVGWAKTGELTHSRYANSATLLVDGTVLVAGGRATAVGATEEIYDPALPESAQGFLRVVTSPPVPSQIGVGDNFTAPTLTPLGNDPIQEPGTTPRDDWGLNWLKLPTRDNYNVCFSEVPGFITPPCQPADVRPGATATVTGTFVPAGYLRVMTDPPLPSTVSVDGIARNDWAVWSYFPPGPHEVCFGPVAGWAPPPCQTVVLEPKGNAVVTGKFTETKGAPGPAGMGMLRVTTSPSVPSQISIDGIARDSFALTWLKLPPGIHRVSFSAPPGYAALTSSTLVRIEADKTATVEGLFHRQGFLRVITDPPVAATVSVGGIPRNDWGVWTALSPGPTEVCFGPVKGFVTPICQKATVAPGGTTVVTGKYGRLP